MKKSVVIIIGVIYVVAIAVVSFLGVNFKVFDPVYYIRSIEIYDDDMIIHEGKKVVYAYFNEDGVAEYQIKCKFATSDDMDEDAELSMREGDPEKLAFDYDKQTPGVTVTEDGLVRFTKDTMIEIVVNPRDNSDCSDRITIITLYP